MILIRIFTFICTFFIALNAHAQTPGSESLDQQLQKASSKLEQATIYFESGDSIAIHDTSKAISLIRKGIAIDQKDPFIAGVGYFYLGRVYMDFSRIKAELVFDSAIQFLNQVRTPESYIYQSRTYANKAVMAQINGDNKTYISLFLEKAIPLAAKGGDSLRMADGYMNISLPFMNYGEYDKATLYLNKSAALFQRLAPNDLRCVDVYCHLAKIYLLLKNIPKAGEQLSKASRILQQDPQSMYAPYFHTIESMYLIQQKQWSAAEKTIEKGLSVAELQKNRFDIRQLLYQKSSLFNAQENWTAAKEVLLKMYNEGYLDLITDKQQLFGDLAILESRLGHFKEAYEWKVKQSTISEEVYAQQTKTQIADLEAKYNFVQKEKELLLAQSKTEKQRQLIWLIILSSILILGGLYWNYRNRRRRAVQQLKQQQQIALGRALLEGEERERSRLARDLHDGLGGMLAGIRLNLSQMIEGQKTVEGSTLQTTVDRLAHSVNELRRISRNMMPESLLQSGLEVALKDLCDEASMRDLKVSFRAFDLQNSLSPQVSVMIYRIIQEIVYNAVKHAEASRIMVQCSQSENVFFITVEDNGKGFSPDNIPATSRGLNNIRNRVNLLNGKIDIETSSDGTIINIELHVE